MNWVLPDAQRPFGSGSRGATIRREPLRRMTQTHSRTPAQSEPRSPESAPLERLLDGEYLGHFSDLREVAGEVLATRFGAPPISRLVESCGILDAAIESGELALVMDSRGIGVWLTSPQLVLSKTPYQLARPQRHDRRRPRPGGRS